MSASFVLPFAWSSASARCTRPFCRALSAKRWPVLAGGGQAAGLALWLATAGLLPSPVAAESDHTELALGVPAECATRSLVTTQAVAFWSFSVNFDAMGAQGPSGCLMAFDATGQPAYFPVPCQTVGSVTYANGLGFFQGGRVECSINLQAYLPGLTNALDSAQIQGLGRLSPFELSTNPYRSPVAYYAPNLPGDGLGMFLRASANNGLISGQFRTNVNGFNFETTLAPHPFVIPATTADEQTWSSTYWVRRQPADTFLTVLTRVNGVSWDILTQGVPLPIDFQSDGGTFLIGGSPLGPNFLGTLQEVIVSSADAYEPPKVPQLVPLDPPPLFVNGFE